MNLYQINRKINSIKKRFFIALLLCCGLSIQCQEGTLDTTFNSSGPKPGVTYTTTVPIPTQGNALAVDANGKIVATGGNETNAIVVARYLTDGSLDTTFNSTGSPAGFVFTDVFLKNEPFPGSININAVVIQPDGKIVVAGNASFQVGGVTQIYFLLARYLPNGSLDTTFYNNIATEPGIVLTNITGSAGALTPSMINSIALQPNGNIVAVGTNGNNLAIARYLPNGSLDTTFNSSGTQPGVVINTGGFFAYAVALDVNGNILVFGETAGSQGIILRYLSTGVLDTSFNGSGRIVNNSINALQAGAIQADGKILAAGYTDSNNFFLFRYLANGTLDTSFNGTGGVATPITGASFAQARAITIQSNGKIVLGGFATVSTPTVFALARYLANGTLDTTFDPLGSQPGITLTNINNIRDVINGLAVQTNGYIVAIGNTNNTSSNTYLTLARYISSPALNPTTITTPVVVSGQPITLSGTAQNESIVTIIIDGVATTDATVTPINTSGDETNTMGTWSVVIPALTLGTHTIVASANYQAGHIIILSAPLTICVTPLTVIITPSLQTVCPGSTIILTANVSGGTAVSYLWTTPGRGTIITTTNTLTLPDATTADSGNYTVVVVDNNSCDSLPSAPSPVMVTSCTSQTPISMSAILTLTNPGTYTVSIDGAVTSDISGNVITNNSVLNVIQLS